MPTQPTVIFNVKGRYGVNAPLACPPDQAIEAINVDWYRSTLARKRSGALTLSLAGGTAQTGVESFLFSHVPAFDQTARELWSVDDAATPRFKRLTGGVNWADVTLKDNVATRPMDINACSFNGKLFFGYDTTVNRLQVWDGSTVRRVGLATPAAATVANTGGGAYAATIRYYKVIYIEVVGTAIVRQSEPSPVVSFTPSGAGTAARVTKPAALSEGETHWLLYGSPDGSNFVLLSTIVVGTATYDDSASPSAYAGAAIPISGTHVCPPSAKYLVADDSRLVMAGNWETAAGDGMAPSNRRVWWTSPPGSTDAGDDERISNTNLIKSYTDVDEAITGLSFPLEGEIYIFSYNSMWKMVGTSVANAPYVRYRVTSGKGCIEHKTIVIAEDENGAPCLYWMSPQGPCRKGTDGQFSLIDDVSDIWDTVNLAATNVVAHASYHRDKHQIWWWLATSGANDPDVRIIFDCHLGRVVEAGKVRRGWAKHTGDSCAARCSTMHSNTVAASMSRDLKPYIGRSTGLAIWKCDTGTTDNGTTYKATITTRPLTPAGLGTKAGSTIDATLAAEAAAGVTIRLSIVRDMGVNTTTANAILTPSAAGETRVFPDFDGSAVSDAKAIHYIIGDSAAIDNAWNLDALTIPTTGMGIN